MTFAQFAEAHGLKLTATSVPSNPNMLPDPKEKPWRADHWHVVLSGMMIGNGPAIPGSFQGYYSMGIGHRARAMRRRNLSRGTIAWEEELARTPPPPPSLPDYLQDVAADVLSVHHGESFDQWADNADMDRDSRRAERAYQACRDERDQLVRFLGHDRTATLLACTEFDDAPSPTVHTCCDRPAEHCEGCARS